MIRLHNLIAMVIFIVVGLAILFYREFLMVLS